MTNNRDFQQRDLKVIRDGWWIPVRLTSPDKVIYDKAKGTDDTLLGDARKESSEIDPDIGGKILVKKPVVTLRLLDLDRVPQENENWFIEFSETLLDGGALLKYAFSPNNVESAGASMGFIKIYPQDISVA